jgi:hypothetical protein
VHERERDPEEERREDERALGLVTGQAGSSPANGW